MIDPYLHDLAMALAKSHRRSYFIGFYVAGVGYGARPIRVRP